MRRLYGNSPQRVKRCGLTPQFWKNCPAGGGVSPPAEGKAKGRTGVSGRGHAGFASTGGQAMETGWTTEVAHAVPTT